MKKHLKLAALILVSVLLHGGLAFGLSQDAPSGTSPNGVGLKVEWKAPLDVPASTVAGFNVYRSDSILGHYTKINPGDSVKGLFYQDTGLTVGVKYYYKVATVFTDGKESEPTQPAGSVAGAGGTIVLPKIRSFTSDALGKVTYLDEEAVFILDGDPGLTASFSIAGAQGPSPMVEMTPGVYKGLYKVPGGLKVKETYAEASLVDAQGGQALAATPATISFYGSPRPSFTGLYAGILESDRVGLNWPGQADAAGYYNIYKDTSRIVGVDGMTPISAMISKDITAYVDSDVAPGATYYYVLAVTDATGALTACSENLEVKVPRPGHVSGIESVEEDSGGAVLKPGSTLTVTVRTTPGGVAYFALGEAVREAALKEDTPGVYKGSHTVREGEGVFRTRVAVSFKDQSGGSHFANSATFVSVDAPRTSVVVAGGVKPSVSGITDDTQAVAGTSGRLAAGKTFTVTLTGDPGNKAYFNVGERIWKVPMTEDKDSPGVYKGSYTVRPGDNEGTSPDPLAKVYVTGYLEAQDGTASDPAAAPSPVVVDTSCDITVEASSYSIPADARSQARVSFTVKDADGEPVADRRLSVMLEPPPRYTGVVGGGGVDQPPLDTGQADTSVIGRLEVDLDGLTDSQGIVTATYTSGFAAKTAMLVARDYSTGSVGMAAITTSISSSVSITLTDPAAGTGPVTAPDPIYQLQVDMVPDPDNPTRKYDGFGMAAIPETLTADGVSRATIIATLTTTDGTPVEGENIIFAVSGAGGSLSRPSAVTDSLGRAQVYYIAGIRAGKALITATEPSTGATATKVVTLLADAPAKIFVKAYPDTLPADGVSTSRVVVELADVNWNPTDGVGLSFSLRGGLGAIPTDSAVTDFRGSADFLYTAGTSTGVATIDVTAGSAPPTPDELKAAYSRITAPLVYDNMDYTDLTLIKWYKAAGDQVGRGEPLALMGTPLGDMVVYSPVSGTLDSIIIEPGVYVTEGKEIGAMK